MFVLTHDATWDAETLSTALRHNLCEHASARCRPYQLSASAGAAIYQPGSDTIASLIDRSDHDLYRRRRNERGSGTPEPRRSPRSPAMSAPFGAT
jgi:GGDEF domain-containing protein